MMQWWSKIYKTLASVRTGIILLLIAVVLGALGTVILQRPTTDPDEIQRAYSPSTLMLLDQLGLTDVYHAWWFVLLLGLVSLSIIFASLERWPSSWKFYAQPNRRPERAYLAALPQHREFKIADAGRALEAAERALARVGLKPQRVTANNEVSLYLERHRASVMAVYIVHLSLLLILAGYMVDAIYGYRGSLVLTKGESSNTITIRHRGADLSKVLPFTIRCDGTGQKKYADGAPQQYWSQLAILENGREIKRQQIAVNDPLTYKGIRFYQANFGTSNKIDHLEIMTAAGGGAPRTLTVAPGQPAQLDADHTLSLVRFIPDYYMLDGEVHQRSDNPENPAIRFAIDGKDGHHELWMFPRTDPRAREAQSGVSFVLRDLQLTNFTGLEASHLPGQWSVWGGVLLVVVGLYIAFYLVHMRFWVVVVSDPGKGLMLLVSGTCNKNKDRFERRFATAVEAIGSELEHEQAKSKSSEEQSMAKV